MANVGKCPLLPLCSVIGLEKFPYLPLFHAAFGSFTDVMYSVLPIPIIWKLQMPRKTRVYVILVLSTGYLAVAMGFVGASYRFKYPTDPDPLL